MTRALMIVVALMAVLGFTPAASANARVFYLRWPSVAGQSRTYTVTVNTTRPLRLSIYGQAIPRGTIFDYVVACAHRGPAFLNWDKGTIAGETIVKIKMTAGFRDYGASPVARGTTARVVISWTGG
jgi:hypothetical protein